MRHQDSVLAAAGGSLAMMHGCYPDAGPFCFDVWRPGGPGPITAVQGRLSVRWPEARSAAPLTQFIYFYSKKVFLMLSKSSLSPFPALPHHSSPSGQLKSQRFFLVLLSLVGWSPEWRGPFTFWVPNPLQSYHRGHLIHATPLRVLSYLWSHSILPKNERGKLVKEY